MTDLEGWAAALPGIKSVERLSGDTGLQVGTKWRETRVMMGREATEIMTVTAIDEGHSYTTTAHSNGSDYTTVMAVNDAPRGSTITMTFGAEATTTLSRIFSQTVGRLFVPMLRKTIAKDLADLANAVENPPS